MVLLIPWFFAEIDGLTRPAAMPSIQNSVPALRYLLITREYRRSGSLSSSRTSNSPHRPRAPAGGEQRLHQVSFRTARGGDAQKPRQIECLAAAESMLSLPKAANISDETPSEIAPSRTRLPPGVFATRPPRRDHENTRSRNRPVDLEFSELFCKRAPIFPISMQMP